ncbi:cellulose biosynthesis protein BcsS [Methylocystis sp. WRRC1]|uniref:cellulose biosynthesis protein BcsS n=1 Tax=Methylocystis sp. WRRC1 TaxID=1732014 RepID=UPI001D14D0A9|nr:cellulose biosynthesis protein BcsS [Methylocystis sp. WRRC1]MCC3245521.1 cellulose biosynthesis protein BcsS [Methylocystis sp. WRRC1]
MRVSFRFLATVALAALTSLPEAKAADWYTGVPTDGTPAPRAPRVAIDVAIDGTSQRALSGALIGTIAPFTAMDRSGMRVRLSGLAGTYVYAPSNPFLGEIHGTIVGGAFLFGYEWVFKRATVALYAGGEVVNTSLSPNDPNNSAKGGSGGLKLAADFFTTPTDQTMIAGVLSYSTNYNSYYGRLKFGMALSDHVYVGPEVVALGDNFFQQWRLGGHVSGLRFGALQFGAAAGFLNDRVRGGGVYGTLDTRVTF